MSNGDGMGMRETASVAAGAVAGEQLRPWKCRARVEKWHREADWLAGRAPDEVVERDGNIALNNGIQRLLNLLIGAGGQAYNNANCRLGVGDSSTAAAAAQTDLQAATNKYYQMMDPTFPSVAGPPFVATFKATFASAIGNFAWAEWGIDNGSASGATGTPPMLNRMVQSFGTKTAGSSWVLTATITPS